MNVFQYEGNPADIGSGFTVPVMLQSAALHIIYDYILFIFITFSVC